VICRPLLFLIRLVLEPSSTLLGHPLSVRQMEAAIPRSSPPPDAIVTSFYWISSDFVHDLAAPFPEKAIADFWPPPLFFPLHYRFLLIQFSLSDDSVVAIPAPSFHFPPLSLLCFLEIVQIYFEYVLKDRSSLGSPFLFFLSPFTDPLQQPNSLGSNTPLSALISFPFTFPYI